MRAFYFAFVGWLAFAPALDAQESPKEVFQRGVELSQQGKDKEAKEAFLQVYKSEPKDPAVLWNLGLASAALGEHLEALKFWNELRAVDPEDWPVRAKLVQTYQALGRWKERDREREELIKSWQAAPAGGDIRKATRFCREQVVLAGRKMFVFELFQPSGERKVYLRFIVTDEKGGEDFHFSLGSYDTTTNIARELKEIPADKRLFHLDKYLRNGGHETYGFYVDQPPYETVRADVEKALSGATKPGSATYPKK